MSHHARMLAGLAAALLTVLITTSPAAAFPSVVRVETKQRSSLDSGAFVNRVAVDTPGDVTIADAAGVAQPQSCSAGSPVAALIAAVGAAQVETTYDAGAHTWTVTSINGLRRPAAVPPAGPAWTWRPYVDQSPIPGDEVCTSAMRPGVEVLFYQACGSKGSGCYPGTPLYLRVRDGGPYDIAPQTVPGRGAPVTVHVTADQGPTGANVSTDEGLQSTALATGVLPGETGVSFQAFGAHTIIATKGDGSRAPARLAVCVSEGNDGFCGSTRFVPPAEIPYAPSPCATNGHDGFCGTTDTSGPIAHITNIAQKQVFKKKKGPGQLKGTIETDPNGVKDVKLRLTRVSTSRVLVKAKKKAKAKKRYRTVKRCSAWDDSTALLETAPCGKKGKWFEGELSDLRDSFTYGFAMTLPAGTYTLEVLATDENGYPDVAMPGRSVLTFTVS
jgi:hypothetical protein